MEELNIRLYEPSDFQKWNNFVADATESSFLFDRNYMEYHKNRFTDYSLIIYTNKAWVAILPAFSLENNLFSHFGLTYGGFVFSKTLPTVDKEKILQNVLSFLREAHFKQLYIKPIVQIYKKKIDFGMEYLLVKNQGVLYRKEMNLAIDFANWHGSKSKWKHYKKAVQNGLILKKETTFDGFWNQVLIPKLADKYQTKPVHSVEEISYLHNKFPDKILQYNVYLQNELLAGITLFDFGFVVKSQYGATTSKGMKYRALDFAFIALIDMFQHQKKYFDMGTVNENEGKSYNIGLIQQKEELGCSVYLQEYYKINIS